MAKQARILDQVVTAAMAVTVADMGNLQLVDPATGALKIVVSHGFGWRFLQFFDTVDADSGAACGVAHRQGARIIVENVAASEIFVGTPALEIMVEARALAVQSTPLVARNGNVIGMISTHRRRPGRFTELQLDKMDVLARDAAEGIERAGIVPGSREWSEARGRVLLHSSQELIDTTQHRLNRGAPSVDKSAPTRPRDEAR